MTLRVTLIIFSFSSHLSISLVSCKLSFLISTQFLFILPCSYLDHLGGGIHKPDADKYTCIQCSILCVRQCFMCLCSDIVVYWNGGRSVDTASTYTYRINLTHSCTNE